MFRFTIRDVLWLTVVVALAVALWVQVQHEAGEIRLRESYRALAEDLAQKLQVKNPAAKINISVNGKSIIGDTEFAEPNP
jgi:hypothetical protein